MAFDVVSEDAAMARQNLVDVNKLITFLYPVYEVHNKSRGPRASSTTLNAAPLLGLRWTNLVSDAATGDYLVGYLKGVDYAPKIDEGGFINQDRTLIDGTTSIITTSGAPGTEGQTIKKEKGTQREAKNYIPKTLSINLNFTVLHTHLPGWTKSGNEGHFVFGDDKTNGKFPNAFGVVDVQKKIQVLTTDENGKPKFKVETVGDSLATSVLKK